MHLLSTIDETSKQALERDTGQKEVASKSKMHLLSLIDDTSKQALERDAQKSGRMISLLG